MEKVQKSIASIGRFLKKRWYIILLLVGIGSFFTYKNVIAKNTEDEKTAYIVTTGSLQESLSLSGQIDASEKATLKFQTGGKVTWVGVKEGDYVKKYQGIASLDQREVEKQLQRSLNLYMKSRWNFDQTKQDNKEAQYKDGDIGDRMKRLIDQSQFDLNNAVIDVELKDIAKEYAFLSTPIEGIVTKANPAHSGVNISPVQAEYEIVNPQTLFFSVNADQTEVVRLNPGQQGKIILDAYPNVTLPAGVSEIAYLPKTDETGTVYEVKMSFGGGDMNMYRLGMTGDVEFVLREKDNIIVIPSLYLKTVQNKTYVLKKNGTQKTEVEVKTGLEVDGDTEITQGLSTGDTIYEFPAKQ